MDQQAENARSLADLLRSFPTEDISVASEAESSDQGDLALSAAPALDPIDSFSSSSSSSSSLPRTPRPPASQRSAVVNDEDEEESEESSEMSSSDELDGVSGCRIGEKGTGKAREMDAANAAGSSELSFKRSPVEFVGRNGAACAEAKEVDHKEDGTERVKPASAVKPATKSLRTMNRKTEYSDVPLSELIRSSNRKGPPGFRAPGLSKTPAAPRLHQIIRVPPPNPLAAKSNKRAKPDSDDDGEFFVTAEEAARRKRRALGSDE